MFSQRGGEHVAMESQQEAMVEKTKRIPYKCFRTYDCKICNPDFHKKLSDLAIHIKMDNKVALLYLLKMGGYTQFSAFKNQQVNLALFAVSWDHIYCRIFIKQIE